MTRALILAVCLAGLVVPSGALGAPTPDAEPNDNVFEVTGPISRDGAIGTLSAETDVDSNPTDEQMNEELQIRQEFLDYVGPRLAEHPRRPPHAFGNVSRAELHGGNVWSQLNHYLVVLTVDIGIPNGLDEAFPRDAVIAVLGPYEALQTWPEIVVSQAA